MYTVAAVAVIIAEEESERKKFWFFYFKRLNYGVGIEKLRVGIADWKVISCPLPRPNIRSLLVLDSGSSHSDWSVKRGPV